MPEYRILRNQETRRESDNLAYSPLHSNEGPYLAARQAMQGLEENENPNAIVDRLMSLDVAYDAAIRWADAAYAFGFIPAAEMAEKFCKLAEMTKDMPDDKRLKMSQAMTEIVNDKSATPRMERSNRVPSLDELREVDTRYGKQLLKAKDLMIEALQYFTSDVNSLMHMVQLAAKADMIEDARIILAPEEGQAILTAVTVLLEMGIPLNADMAWWQQPSDPSAMIPFYKSILMQFPNDLTLTRRTGCIYMFGSYAGSSVELGVRTTQQAFSLLPHPNDDSDPDTMGLLYEAGAGNYVANQYPRAKALLSRFLNHAPAYGHRKRTSSWGLCC